MATLIKVGTKNEIPNGKAKMVQAGDKQIAVFNLNGNFCAIDEHCTHRAGPLSEGSLEGNRLTCPWHGATFDITTGKVMSPPAARDVACYKIKLEGEDVMVELP